MDPGNHGSESGGALVGPWIYIGDAYKTLMADTSYGTAGDIAVIGAADSTASSANCGAAAHYASVVDGYAPTYYDTVAQIHDFFTALAAGTLTPIPRVIHIVDDHCTNGLTAADITELVSDAGTIANFVNDGGGLFANTEHANNSADLGYQWLTTLFPSLTVVSASGSDPLLTTAGQADFPSLTDADIVSPWHSGFGGNLGDLEVLATQTGTNVIIGGAAVTLGSTLSLVPANPLAATGSGDTLAATVLDANGNPVSGATVTFSVTSGPNVGTTGTVSTNANGVADWPYTGSPTVGTDTVSATVTVNSIAATNTASIQWATTPGVPTIDSVGPGDASLVVAFTAPASDGGTPITSYAASAISSGPTVTVTGTTSPITLTGLTPGTLYTIDVAATNGIGAGPAAAYSSMVTPAADPSVAVSPPDGEVGVGYTYTLTASGGTGPFAWAVSAGSLPAGLSLDPATGIISGTPTAGAAGTTDFTVEVTDADARTATDPVALSVAAAPAVSVSPTDGEVGVPYSDTLTASGGTGPFTWAVTSGALPDGLSLDPSTGAISGTPTASGTALFTVAATDAVGAVATDAVALGVTAAPAVAVTPSNGEVGVAYSDTLTASGGTGPFTWAVTSGALPDGLSLDPSTGIISGTPASDAAGTAMFTVAATDAVGAVATDAIALTVAPVLATAGEPPDGEVGIAYSDPLTASGGTGPDTWAVSAGTLPAGLSLDAATGVISGTPTAAAVGSDPFTYEVTDADGATTTHSVTLTIVAAPSLSVTPTGGEVGAAYSDALTASGGTGPDTWAVSVGALPAGLSLDPATGVISGAPSGAGTDSFTVTVTDADGATAPGSTTITIVAAPTVAVTLPGGEVGATYADTLTVSDGTGPYTWAVSDGTLPDGLSLDASTGIISGTPSGVGTDGFAVTVTDAFGVTASDTVGLDVTAAPSLSLTPANGEVGVAYSDTLTVSGGTGPFTWAVSAGALPAGLSLDPATGVISGTPTAAAAGTGSFTVSVTDADGVTATDTVALTVAAVPSLSVTLESGTVGVAYSDTLAVSGGIGPYTWAVSDGAPPAGLSLDAATGVISGIPAAGTAGTARFSVGVTDANGVTAIEAVGLVIAAAAPTLPSAPLDVTATNDDGTVIVNWSPPSRDGGSPVTRYFVTAQPGGATCTTLATTTRCTFRTLTPGVRYDFTVIAANVTGTGTSIGLSNKVVVLARPTVPLHLRITAGDRRLAVRFSPPASDGGTRITSYQRSLNGGRTWTKAVVSSLRTVLTGVLDGSTDRIELRAVNAVGAGPATRVVKVRVPQWFHDPLSAAQRHHEIRVPAAPATYTGAQRTTTADDRAQNGTVAMPAATLHGRQLQPGEATGLGSDPFAFNSSQLTVAARTAIREVARSLRYVTAVTCEGYSDYAGEYAHELPLSQQRARNVCAALQADGVHIHFSAVGFAGAQPAVVGGSAISRAANRRVIIVIDR